MFLPSYSYTLKGWYVCRSSTPDTVSNVMRCPDKEHCLRICAALNTLQSELQAAVICDLSTTCKSDTQTASDSCRASRSKTSWTRGTSD